MSTKTVSEALKAEVAKRGITQEQAAESMRVGYNQVNRWIAGVEPKANAYGPLMEFLSVDLAQLGAMVLESRIRKLESGA